MKINNLVAKHSPHRGGKHKDRKRASRQVRGHKHKEKEDRDGHQKARTPLRPLPQVWATGAL